jgi:hypothetical protein
MMNRIQNLLSSSTCATTSGGGAGGGASAPYVPYRGSPRTTESGRRPGSSAGDRAAEAVAASAAITDYDRGGNVDGHWTTGAAAAAAAADSRAAVYADYARGCGGVGGGGGGLGQGRADVRLNSVRQNVEHMRTVVHDLGGPGSPGRSVQVDPVKPMLNAPKTKRLKK